MQIGQIRPLLLSQFLSCSGFFLRLVLRGDFLDQPRCGACLTGCIGGRPDALVFSEFTVFGGCPS